MNTQKIKEALEYYASADNMVVSAILAREALAELEKPADEDSLELAMGLINGITLHGINDETAEIYSNLIQQYAEAYHAKKCGECVEQGQKSHCDFCEDGDCEKCSVFNGGES